MQTIGGPEGVAFGVHVEAVSDVDVGLWFAVFADHSRVSVDVLEVVVLADEIADQAIRLNDLPVLFPSGRAGADGDEIEVRVGKFRADFSGELFEILEDLVGSFAAVDVVGTGVKNNDPRVIGGDDAVEVIN